MVFDLDFFNNEGLKVFDMEVDFESYFKCYCDNFWLIDLDCDDQFELLYNGLMNVEDLKEYLEIYIFSDGKFVQVYVDVGYFMVYKIQLNMGEILLYVYQYFCCLNGLYFFIRFCFIGQKM